MAFGPGALKFHESVRVPRGRGGGVSESKGVSIYIFGGEEPGGKKNTTPTIKGKEQNLYLGWVLLFCTKILPKKISVASKFFNGLKLKFDANAYGA